MGPRIAGACWRSARRARMLDRTLRGAAAALALACSAAARADEADARWTATVEAARHEGELTVAASPNLFRRDFLAARWKADFPDVKLTLATVRGSNFLPMVATERNAGRFLWDVFQSGPTTAIEAARQGYFDPLRPELVLPEAADAKVWGGWDDAFYDEKREYVIGLVSDVDAPYYNAALVPPDKVAASGLKLLLDPSLKGRIVWYDPRLEGPGSLFLPLLARELGDDGLRALIVDQQPVFVNNLNAVAEAMARRKAAVALAGQPKADLREFLKAGVALDIRSFGPSPSTAYRSTDGSALALFNRRPHPSAARVFANWYMTKAISAGVAEATRFDSRRADIPPLDPDNAPRAGGDYVDPQRDAGLAVLRKWRAEARRLRPQ